MDLRKVVEKIWTESIYNDVIKDRIWMESDLVASFYMYLRNWCDKKGYYLLLEQTPGGPFKKIKNIGPLDLTLRNSLTSPEDIIAIFEFKHINCRYLPDHSKRVDIVEDFRKLNTFDEINKNILKYFFILNNAHDPQVYCKSCEELINIRGLDDYNKCKKHHVIDLSSLVTTINIMNQEYLNYIYIGYGFCPMPKKGDYSEQYKEDIEKGLDWKRWWGIKKISSY